MMSVTYFCTLLVLCALAKLSRQNEVDDCDDWFCTANWDPVCANNGKTYSNECDLERAMCKDKNLKLHHKGSCGPTNGVAFVRSNLDSSDLTIGAEYSVSFKLFPTKFSPGWQNIIHFTTGVNIGQLGSRVPAIFANGNGVLHICADVNGNTNYWWNSKPIPTNAWTEIQIRQFNASLHSKYQILINGVVEHEVINKNPRTFQNVKLYISDPWHAAQEGIIKDLLHSEAIFDFIELQLKGNTGEEIVEVYQPGVEGRLIRSITLTKGWQKYSFDSLEGVRLHFVNNNLPRNVYLKHPKLYEIGFNDGNRHCRMGSKSQLCSRIQKLGNFLWGGSYAIKKKYEGFTLVAKGKSCIDSHILKGHKHSAYECAESCYEQGSPVFVYSGRRICYCITGTSVTGTCNLVNSHANVFRNNAYTQWSDWSECSTVCNEGERFRTRQCVGGGYQCNKDKRKFVQGKYCFKKSCSGGTGSQTITSRCVLHYYDRCVWHEFGDFGVYICVKMEYQECH